MKEEKEIKHNLSKDELINYLALKLVMDYYKTDKSKSWKTDIQSRADDVVNYIKKGYFKL